MNEHLDPRTFRDPSYPNTTIDVVSPSGMPAISIPCHCTPPTNDGLGHAAPAPSFTLAERIELEDLAELLADLHVGATNSFIL